MSLTLLRKTNLAVHGQVGHSLIGYVVHGQQRFRAYAVPIDPKTPPQLARRRIFRDGLNAWAALTPLQRASWQRRATGIKTGWMGVSYFLSNYLKTHT